MKEIYVSTDIESDGPIPGVNSMLSFGSAAFTKSGDLIGTYTANLSQIGVENPDTMAWWKTQPKAWEACRKDIRRPQEVMPEYVGWLKSLPGKPVFVGYPAGYDFLFIYWYLIKFAGESPFGFSALDIKSYAMAVLNETFRSTTKRNMPKDWFGEHKHNHVAIDDAIEQGHLFINILRHNEASQ